MKNAHYMPAPTEFLQRPNFGCIIIQHFYQSPVGKHRIFTDKAEMQRGFWHKLIMKRTAH